VYGGIVPNVLSLYVITIEDVSTKCKPRIYGPGEFLPTRVVSIVKALTGVSRGAYKK
jgi:hypothetical protein